MRDAVAQGGAYPTRVGIFVDGVPFATHLPDHHLTKKLQDTFDSAGVRLKIPFYLENAASQHALVESGQAVGFMSLLSVWVYKRLNQKHTRKQVVFRPFSPQINQTVSLITPAHRTLSQICQQFAYDFEVSITDIISQTARGFQIDAFDN